MTESPSVDATYTLYRMYDVDDQLLYVGRTFRVETRLMTHRHGQGWWPLIATVRLEHLDTLQELVAAEREAIVSESPQFNIQHSAQASLARARRPLVQTGTVSESAVITQVRDAADEHRRAIAEEEAAILAAVQAGEKQTQIAAVAGRSREHVRLLLRKHAS